jgi:pimeloyl-ACP methyl ester carboxylesterase
VTSTSAQVLTLADGRTLGYADLGDPHGTPVVWCHGGLSSRLEAAPADVVARELGIRLIAPDRPGVGGSDREPTRHLLGWPADVAELMDAGEIDRFAVMGWSLGGPFAAACAYALPERVTMLGLVASCIPPDWAGMVDGLGWMDRRFLRETRHGRAFSHAALTGIRLTAAHAPRVFIRATTRGLSPLARAPLEAGGGRWFAAAIAEGLRNTSGLLDEYRIMGTPWGFDPADIAVPTRIWQGDEDTLVPPAWSARLGDVIAGSRLTVVPGEGHFLPFAHWAELLAAALPDPAG